MQFFRLAGCQARAQAGIRPNAEGVPATRTAAQKWYRKEKRRGGVGWVTFFSFRLSMICAVTECPTWADSRAAALFWDWTQAVRICCHQGDTDCVSHDSSIATAGKGTAANSARVTAQERPTLIPALGNTACPWRATSDCAIWSFSRYLAHGFWIVTQV